MKRHYCLLSGLALLLMTGCRIVCAEAQAVPPSLATILQQRTQSLSHSTFEWYASFRQSPLQFSPEKLAHIQSVAADEAHREAQINGITSKTAIENLTQRKFDKYVASIQVPSFTNEHDWTIARDGDKVLRSGNINPKDRSLSGTVEQYFSNDTGITALCPLTPTKKVDTISSYPTQVWSCPDSCVSYRPLPVTTQIGLDFNPEDYVMLAGLNPLDMYGGHWILVSTTSTTWTLKSTVTNDNRAPIAIEMTLSKHYAGAPISISMTEENALSITYTAEQFTLYNNTWVCSKADYQEIWPNVFSRSQKWSLLGVKASQALSISRLPIPKHAFIKDGRLANVRVSAAEMASNPLAADQIWVNYAWNGTLPTLSDLKRFYSDQHPGEASPDPRKSASLPIIGCLMALTGAVWLFKRRGGSA